MFHRKQPQPLAPDGFATACQTWAVSPHECVGQGDGTWYRSTEHAYQAAKTTLGSDIQFEETFNLEEMFELLSTWRCSQAIRPLRTNYGLTKKKRND